MFENLKLKNRILLGYVPPVALLIISALLVYQSMRTAAYHSSRVNMAYRNVYELRGLELSGSIIQRGARGYYLTKDEKFLKTVEEGEKDLKETVNSLEGLCQAKIEMSGFLQNRNVRFLVVNSCLIIHLVLILFPRVILRWYVSLLIF